MLADKNQHHYHTFLGFYISYDNILANKRSLEKILSHNSWVLYRSETESKTALSHISRVLNRSGINCIVEGKTLTALSHTLWVLQQSETDPDP